MKKYMVIAAALFAFASCDKIDNKPQPQQQQPQQPQQPSNPNPPADPCPTGKLRLTNNSDDPYDVFINGQKNGNHQAGNTVRTLTLSKGTYEIKVQQVSGYILYPTVQEATVTIAGCDEKNLSYP